jgi:hypothetical protein
MTIKQATKIYLCAPGKETEQFINGARWMEHKVIDWLKDNIVEYIWWDPDAHGAIMLDTMLLDLRKTIEK